MTSSNEDRVNLQHLDPKSLRPNPWNSNEVDAANMERLKASIARHGFVKPVIVRELDDGALQILGGQHRAEAAVEMGLREIPVTVLEDIPDDRAKEIGLIDNARYGQDDDFRLLELVEELDVATLQAILPNAEDEFLSSLRDDDIDMDTLETEDETERREEKERDERPARTHTVMRFKLEVADAERVAEEIERVQSAQGFTGSDKLTNAGDALVHLLLGERS